jgi:PAS domain S-box-containing protein
MKAEGQQPSRRRQAVVALWVLGVALVLGVLILGGGYLLKSHSLEARRQAQNELGTIADLKAAQAAEWYRDRVQDTERIARGPIDQEVLRRFLLGASDPARERQVRLWLEHLHQGAYARILLLNAQGRTLLSVPADLVPSSLAYDEAQRCRAMASPEQTVSDLHRDPGHEEVHLSIWVPIGAGPGTESASLGALLFIVDPAQGLYPLLKAWPAPSQSAEIMLIRRDEREAVVLNDLRHQAGAPLALRTSLGPATSRPVAMAALGQEGLAEGPDYRQVPVVAAVRRVAGTPWSLVAKVDEQELYGPIRRRALFSAVGLLALLGLSALGLVMLVRLREGASVRAQLALSQRFEWLIREANDSILLLDSKGRILEANAQAVAQYGYSEAEFKGMSILDMRPPETRASARTQFEQVQALGALRFETVHQRKDGSLITVEISARSFASPDGPRFSSLIRDISERVVKDRELKRMTGLYAALGQVSQAIVQSPSRQELLDRICKVMVESGGFAMAWIGWDDPDTHRVVAVARYGDHLGMLDRVEARSDDTPDGRGAMGTALRAGCPCIINDFLDGPVSKPWRAELIASGFASTAAFPIHEGGQVRGALAVYARERDFFGTHEAELLEEASTDISYALEHLEGEARRQHTEAALRESEQFLSEAQEAGGIGTYIWDIPENRWRSSASLDQIFGIDEQYPRDFDGWVAIVAPEFRSEMHHYVAGILARHERFDLDYPIVRPSDGIPRWVHGRGLIHCDADGQPLTMTGVIQDITERRAIEAERLQLEHQLQQSQKLESLGSLAGGVAHDMNNVLGAILSLSCTLREGADPFGSEARNLDTIISACMRGRSVVKGLLFFARKDLQEEQALDLNDLVREMGQLLGHAMLQRVHLEMDLEEGMGLLRGERGALSHALMNLCVNAMDAMPGGGSIHIHTCSTREGGILLRVQDTGAGMAPEVLAKAMEPFFTTKPQGKGTGLGLAMVYGTMKAHDGTLELLSQVEVGTEAVLFFPPTRVVPRHAQPVPPVVPEQAVQPKLRILLVDDDELIRESVAPMLEMLGHEVLTASGGASALRLLEASGAMDLVILDMNMPGMSGADTLPRVLEICPGMPVVMATGFSDHEIAPLLAGHPEVSILRKPFSMKEFQRKLDNISFPQSERTRP